LNLIKRSQSQLQLVTVTITVIISLRKIVPLMIDYIQFAHKKTLDSHKKHYCRTLDEMKKHEI